MVAIGRSQCTAMAPAEDIWAEDCKMKEAEGDTNEGRVESPSGDESSEKASTAARRRTP